jgi:hypothetical protein
VEVPVSVFVMSITLLTAMQSRDYTVQF